MMMGRGRTSLEVEVASRPHPKHYNSFGSSGAADNAGSQFPPAYHRGPPWSWLSLSLTEEFLAESEPFFQGWLSLNGSDLQEWIRPRNTLVEFSQINLEYDDFKQTGRVREVTWKWYLHLHMKGCSFFLRGNLSPSWCSELLAHRSKGKYAPNWHHSAQSRH